jgi:PAS domain S-box-containing protein
MKSETFPANNRKDPLDEDSDKYRNIFEEAPISLWQEDYSEVKARLEELRKQGVQDIRSHLLNNQETVLELASLVKVLDVNQASLDLYGAESREQLLGPLNKVFLPETMKSFMEELIAVFEGREALEINTIGRKIGGEVFPYHLSVRFPPPDGNFGNVLVSVQDISQQRAYEEALKAGEERYRQMFQHNRAIQLLIDSETGDIVDANAAAAEFYGYSCEKLRSMKITDLNTQASQKTHQNMRSVIKEGHRTFHFVHRVASGELKDVEVSSGSLDLGARKHIYSIVHDITASKRAEKELKESREMFSFFTDQIPAVVFIKDENGRLQFVNQTMKELFSAHKWLNKKAQDYLPKDIGEQVIADDKLALQKGQLIREEWIPTDSGEVRCFQTHKFKFERGAKPPLLGGVAIDITQRKAFEQSLEMRDQLLEGLTRAFHCLLGDDNFSESIKQFLALIGEAANADRTYIFSNHTDPRNGEALMTQRYEWRGQGVSSQIDNPELVNLPYSKGFARWLDELSQGKVIKGPIKDFPLSERETLVSQDIASILVAPVLLDSRLWGFLGFDDCGSEREWTDVEVSLLMAAAGGLSNAIKREQAESGLRESKETLEAFFNAITEYAFLLDKEGKILAVNKTLEDRLGLNKNELIGRAGLDFVTGPIGPWNKSYFQEVVNTGQPCIFREQRAQQILETSLYPVPAASGAVESVAGFSRDITDQVEFEKKLQQAYDNLEKRVEERTRELVETNEGLNMEIRNRLRTEKALKNSEQRLELALKGADLGLWDHNFLTDKRYYDRGWAEMLGYSMEEIESMDPQWEDLVHPDDLSATLKAVEEHIKGNTNFYESEYRLRSKSGKWKWILSRGKVVEWDDQGKPARFTGTHLDLTDRKLAEEQLKISLHEKEILLAEIHHRVKNNLQIVSSLLSLQSGHVTDSNVLSAIQDSQSRVRSMALIHDQLYQSRDITRIDFSVYLKNLTQSLLLTYAQLTSYVNLRVNAEKVHFAIETAIPCGLIVNELVTNSLKHAFEKGVAGEVKVELSLEQGDRCLMIVSDNGRGLPEDLDVRTSKSLGLRLVRELAESQLMGGLEVSSNKGTEFRISFKDRKR